MTDWFERQKVRLYLFWLMFWHRSGLWPNEGLRQRDEWLAEGRRLRKLRQRKL